MQRQIVRNVIVASAAALVLVHSAPRLQAIGPTVMMFYGAPLKTPVFVTGADTSPFGDLHRPRSIALQDLAGRPYVSIALFWGPPNDPAVNGTRNLVDLRPEMAWQHGRFYPATATHPAALVTTSFTKGQQGVPPPQQTAMFVSGGPVSTAALAVLQRVGVVPPVKSRG